MAEGTSNVKLKGGRRDAREKLKRACVCERAGARRDLVNGALG